VPIKNVIIFYGHGINDPKPCSTPRNETIGFLLMVWLPSLSRANAQTTSDSDVWMYVGKNVTVEGQDFEAVKLAFGSALNDFTRFQECDQWKISQVEPKAFKIP
jgi:hypothetical protein